MPLVIVGALLVGLTLGLMGSGGSILTVPVLVYVLGHNGKVAIAESLAIVGSIALITLLPYARSHLVHWRNVLFFGIPGMAGTYTGAWLSHFVPVAVQLALFAVVLLVGAVLMFRRSRGLSPPDAFVQATAKAISFWLIGMQGLAVGLLSGLVGVGGGFLIVPALVVFSRLPLRAAIGTSLAIIALNSSTGFLKYLDVLEGLGAAINWPTVFAFVSIGIVGSFVGHRLATRLHAQTLQRAFAAFLLLMGLFVLGMEGPKLFPDASPPSPSATIASPVTPSLAYSRF